MTLEIDIPGEFGIAEQMKIKSSLQKIAKNLNSSNLSFISQLSEKPGINETLEDKKGMIQTFI